jgi:hypothetical protein
MRLEQCRLWPPFAKNRLPCRTSQIRRSSNSRCHRMHRKWRRQRERRPNQSLLKQYGMSLRRLLLMTPLLRCPVSWVSLDPGAKAVCLWQTGLQLVLSYLPAVWRRDADRDRQPTSDSIASGCFTRRAGCTICIPSSSRASEYQTKLKARLPWVHTAAHPTAR